MSGGLSIGRDVLTGGLTQTNGVFINAANSAAAAGGGIQINSGTFHIGNTQFGAGGKVTHSGSSSAHTGGVITSLLNNDGTFVNSGMIQADVVVDGGQVYNGGTVENFDYGIGDGSLPTMLTMALPLRASTLSMIVNSGTFTNDFGGTGGLVTGDVGVTSGWFENADGTVTGATEVFGDGTVINKMCSGKSG